MSCVVFEVARDKTDSGLPSYLYQVSHSFLLLLFGGDFVSQQLFFALCSKIHSHHVMIACSDCTVKWWILQGATSL